MAMRVFEGLDERKSEVSLIISALVRAFGSLVDPLTLEERYIEHQSIFSRRDKCLKAISYPPV